MRRAGVPCVWHAVRPVRRFRRYITGRYFVRSPAFRIDDANGGIEQVIQARSTSSALQLAKTLTPDLSALLDPSTVTGLHAGHEFRIGERCEVLLDQGSGAGGKWQAALIHEKLAASGDNQLRWQVELQKGSRVERGASAMEGGRTVVVVSSRAIRQASAAGSRL